MFGIIEIIIIIGIIAFQFYLAYKLWFKIKMYKAIYDFEDLPMISQKNVSKEVIESGDVAKILQYVDVGEGTINITFLKYIPKSKVLTTIVKYINVYLIKNKGATIDFHLIKDIVNTHTETIETQIENRVPAPLYLGLAATMVGIIVGLFSVDFSGNSTAALNAIQPLIDGVKWAMSASVIGLIITTIFSIKIYKDAQTEAEEEKSEFLSKLQSELMPKMATGNLPEVSILSDKLDGFARTTNNTVSQLDEIVRMSHKSVEYEHLLVKDISNLDVKGLTTANIKVFKNLEGMMDSFKNFAGYYNKLDKSLASTDELLTNLKNFVNNTKSVNIILEEIKNSIGQSNEATTFFNKHIQSFERYNDAVIEAVAKNDSAFQKAVEQLTNATLKQFDSFTELISTFDSKLTDAFTKSVQKFAQTMDDQVKRTEEAFEKGRPKFEKLDKLDELDKLNKLETIEERLISIESQLISVISNGNKDIVSALKNISKPGDGNHSPQIYETEVVRTSLIDIIIKVLKISTYVVIIIYGSHSVLQYFNLMD